MITALRAGPAGTLTLASMICLHLMGTPAPTSVVMLFHCVQGGKFPLELPNGIREPIGFGEGLTKTAKGYGRPNTSKYAIYESNHPCCV